MSECWYLNDSILADASARIVGGRADFGIRTRAVVAVLINAHVFGRHFNVDGETAVVQRRQVVLYI